MVTSPDSFPLHFHYHLQKSWTTQHLRASPKGCQGLLGSISNVAIRMLGQPDTLLVRVVLWLEVNSQVLLSHLAGE